MRQQNVGHALLLEEWRKLVDKPPNIMRSYTNSSASARVGFVLARNNEIHASDARDDVVAILHLGSEQNGHPKPELQILDIGCGPERITIEFTKHVHRGHLTGMEYILVPSKGPAN